MDWSAELTPGLLATLPALARMLGLVFTLPLVSSRHVPVRFRIGLALLMTLAVAPGVCVATESVASLSSGSRIPQFLVMLVHELLLGASMGLAAQVVLAGARLAGTVVESLSGMSFGLPASSHAADGAGGPVIGQLFWWTTLAVFVSAGGANEVIGGAFHSFQVWPAGTAGFDSGMLKFLCGAIVNGFEFGMRAALPAVVALLVAGAILGITQRNCPQLGGLQIGLGLKSIAGLIVTSLLLISVPWIINGGLQVTWLELRPLLSGSPG